MTPCAFLHESVFTISHGRLTNVCRPLCFVDCMRSWPALRLGLGCSMQVPGFGICDCSKCEQCKPQAGTVRQSCLNPKPLHQKRVRPQRLFSHTFVLHRCSTLLKEFGPVFLGMWMWWNNVTKSKTSTLGASGFRVGILKVETSSKLSMSLQPLMTFMILR